MRLTQVLHRHCRLSKDAAARTFVGDRVRQFDHAVSGNDICFRISAQRTAAIGDAVSFLDGRDAIAQCIDNPGRFQPQPGRKADGIKSAALIGVDEIDADHGVLHTHLTRTGLRQRNVLQREDFGSAEFGESEWPS